MITNLNNVTPENPLATPALVSSLWLRLGFFSGASLVMIGVTELFGGNASAVQALGAVAVGVVLAALSLRRSLAALEESETSPQMVREAAVASSL